MKYKILPTLILILFSGFARAQEDTLFNESSKTFVAVPMINRNPVMKTGFGGMAMYFFKPNKQDTLSPPSNFTVFGLYSTNKSHILAPMVRLFWNEDRDRANSAFANMRMNNNFLYNVDGEDVRMVYSEIRNIFAAEYSHKIIGDFFIGALYVGTQTNYKFDQGTDAENEFTKEFFKQAGIEDNFVSSVGLNFSFDNRDYIYYPTKGMMFSVRPKLNRKWLGSENNFEDTDFTFVYYLPLSSNKVLGISSAGGFGTGDIPFSEYQNYGIRNKLRGYPTGKYRGKNMVTLQAEYRWNFYKRWGMVAFAGTGSIWGGTNDGGDTFERKWLPSLGGGMRYMINREKRINLRLDYGWGVDGNDGFYFGIMEAF